MRTTLWGERGAGSRGFMLHKQAAKVEPQKSEILQELAIFSMHQCRSIFSHETSACRNTRHTKGFCVCIGCIDDILCVCSNVRIRQ